MAKKQVTKKKTKTEEKSKLKTLLLILIIMIVGLLTGAGVKIKIDYDNLTAVIDYLEETEETEEETPEPQLTDGFEIDGIEYGTDGITINGEEIPTVESVESKMQVTQPEEEQECPEGEECGMGSYVPYLNTSSPQAFANDTLGRCIDVDFYAGSQCYDLMDAFFENYAGYVLTTCGTGAAKGAIADGCWQKNARDKFDMIWEATKLQPGDIAFFSTGIWGHTGMVMGYYNNGYITLLGQNQGGKACPGGGAETNIINISLRDFIGAFRPKKYIKPEPKPTPKPTPVAPDSGIVKPKE